MRLCVCACVCVSVCVCVRAAFKRHCLMVGCQSAAAAVAAALVFLPGESAKSWQGSGWGGLAGG